jgi:hypothetical protein
MGGGKKDLKLENVAVCVCASFRVCVGSYAGGTNRGYQEEIKQKHGRDGIQEKQYG